MIKNIYAELHGTPLNVTIMYLPFSSLFIPTVIILAIICKDRYVPLDSCLPQIPEVYSDPGNNWPEPWPERLTSKPSSLSIEAYGGYTEESFYEDTKNWSTLVSVTYFHSFAINWSSIRNVMDMNAAFGGYDNLLTQLSLN